MNDICKVVKENNILLFVRHRATTLPLIGCFKFYINIHDGKQISTLTQFHHFKLCPKYEMHIVHTCLKTGDFSLPLCSA